MYTVPSNVSYSNAESHIYISYEYACRSAGNSMSDASTAVAGLPVTQQWPQRENLAEFVAHKREIFLVQISLDTKRAEIRKMEVSKK